MSILSPILMTTDIQKAYLRGYAKGRAFQKKNDRSKDRELAVKAAIGYFQDPVDFSMASRWHKVYAFFRNGLSL